MVDYVVELVLKIAARSKGIPSMVQALATVMGQARLQRGCVDCRLYAETGNPQSICYLEQWSTLQDLESQLRSQRFGMLLAIMETAPEAPDLQVRTVSEQHGLEYVRSVRLARDGAGPIVESQGTGTNIHPRSIHRREQPLTNDGHLSPIS